ncbi:MAG TPA: Rieske 2Fe-2S domain-containing protein [Roseimicrobium sp.]|nr:Rieske 2Fe-2S domain-containing protein [Roseimicrobium sp.]
MDDSGYQFVAVADVESLPEGKGRTVHVRGREYAIYHLPDGFAAIDDACTHRDASLGAGFLHDGCVICPLHGWTFDLKTGRCHNNGARPVRTYPTRIENGKVMLGLPDGR